MSYNRNTRIIDLTLGELLEAVEQRVRQAMQDNARGASIEKPVEGRFVYGLSGIAQLLGCSKTTASRQKASGDYDEAITQVGQLLIIDAEKFLQIAREKKILTNKNKLYGKTGNY